MLLAASQHSYPGSLHAVQLPHSPVASDSLGRVGKGSIDKTVKGDKINGLEDLVRSKNVGVRVPEVVI